MSREPGAGSTETILRLPAPCSLLPAHMNERTKQFRVGLIVFATILLGSTLILWNSDFTSLPFRGRYEVSVLVEQAPGVSPGTPVRRHGLLIGRVDRVEDTDEGALITLSIDPDKEIKTNEFARIRASLMGDAVVEIVQGSRVGRPVAPPGGGPSAQSAPGGDGVTLVQAQTGPGIVPPGGRIDGQYSPNPLDMLGDLQADLKQSIIALGTAGEEVAELADRINTVLGANDMQRITALVESTERAMAQFATVGQNFNDIVGDEEFKQQLKAGLVQLPVVMADLQAILGALEGAVTSADQNLKNLQGLTGPLGDRGVAIVANLERSVRNLEELLAQVALFTKNINDSEGTLGLLIRDRTTYDNINATMAQANAMIHDVRQITSDPSTRARIRQILDNIANLSDKMARDPARIIRGVANRETPLN
jgi:phospholipid/cholesterol/gamma-HCH transport system substrate-binding protein